MSDSAAQRVSPTPTPASTPKPPALLRVFWIVDIAVAVIFMRFFFVGLGDGTVSAFNIVLWLGLIAVLAIVLAGAHAARAGR